MNYLSCNGNSLCDDNCHICDFRICRAYNPRTACCQRVQILAAMGYPYMQYRDREQMKNDAYKIIDGNYPLEEKVKAGRRVVERWFQREPVTAAVMDPSPQRFNSLCRQLEAGTALLDWSRETNYRYLHMSIKSEDLRKAVIESL